LSKKERKLLHTANTERAKVNHQAKKARGYQKSEQQLKSNGERLAKFKEKVKDEAREKREREEDDRDARQEFYASEKKMEVIDLT
jgi:hypothetical protein